MEDQQTRTMTWMAGILLALVAVVVLIKPGDEEDDGDKTTLDTTDPFPDLKAEAITALSLTPAQGPAIRLSRQEDGGWNLTEPLSARADEGAVSAVLAALESLECSEPLGGEDLAQFGLQPPVIAVSAATDAGTTYALRVGNDTPVGWTSYVLCGEGDTAARTSKQKLSASFPTTAEDYRDRAALDLSPFDVPATLTITQPAEEEGGGDITTLALQAAEGSGRWTVQSGEGGWRPADQGRAQDILRKLRELAIESFSAAPLMPPITTLTLSTASGQTTTIQIGANGSARVPTQQAPVTLDPEVIGAVLSVKPADILSHDLFSALRPGEASALRISLGDRSFEAERTDSGWSNPAAEDLIATLQIVRVERNSTPAAPDAAGTPWGTLRLQGTADLLEEIDVFAPTDPEQAAYPARSRTTGEHFAIPATEIARIREALPAS